MGVSILDGPYFSLGRSGSGQIHVTQGLWGPALCETPLRRIDDRRHYTVEELDAMNVCDNCYLRTQTFSRDAAAG